MHTTSVGPEVSLYSSASDKLQCSWTSMKVYVGPGAPSTKTLSGALSVSPTLHLSAIVWLRLKVTLLPRSIPTNALGVAVISAGPKYEGASWSKSPQDLG